MNNTNFKNSGIEWIGEIPEHWKVKKLKYLIINSVSGEVIDKKYWNSGNELLYTCQKEPMYSDFHNFPKNKRTNGNCLLLTRNATPYVFIPKENSIYSNVVQKIILPNNYDRRFIKYSIQIGVESLEVNGNTIPSYNMEIWKNIYFCDIDLFSQQQIAEFLDKKCYAIDKTLQNLQQKIQTLTEYKKALITKCVCKGLNNSKNVNFKNIKISYLFNIVAGGDLPNLISDVKTDELNIPIYSNGTDENALYGFTNIAKIHKPCITISGRGTIGFCALRKEPFYPIVRLLCLTPKTNEANINFLYYALKNVNFDFNQTAIPQLTAPMIKQIKIPLPPLHEQQQIAEFLDKKCNKIDRLNEIYNQQIQYLSEYKKSLIYEFVSGKKCI